MTKRSAADLVEELCEAFRAGGRSAARPVRAKLVALGAPAVPALAELAIRFRPGDPADEAYYLAQIAVAVIGRIGHDDPPSAMALADALRALGYQFRIDGGAPS